MKKKGVQAHEKIVAIHLTALLVLFLATCGDKDGDGSNV